MAGVTSVKQYFLVKDQVGSILQVIDQDGVVVQDIVYDDFGQVLSDSNPGFQALGFAGGMYDPVTGLVRFGARDYDGEIGRWLERDPIMFEAGDTNLYAYVNNDPINYIDPLGLDAKDADLGKRGAPWQAVIGIIVDDVVKYIEQEGNRNEEAKPCDIYHSPRKRILPAPFDPVPPPPNCLTCKKQYEVFK
jgi:RHS repeat-associated protein